MFSRFTTNERMCTCTFQRRKKPRCIHQILNTYTNAESQTPFSIFHEFLLMNYSLVLPCHRGVDRKSKVCKAFCLFEFLIKNAVHYYSINCKKCSWVHHIILFVICKLLTGSYQFSLYGTYSHDMACPTISSKNPQLVCFYIHVNFKI